MNRLTLGRITTENAGLYVSDYSSFRAQRNYVCVFFIISMVLRIDRTTTFAFAAVMPFAFVSGRHVLSRKLGATQNLEEELLVS